MDFTIPESGDPRSGIVMEVAPGKAYRPTADGWPLAPAINSSYLEQS
ncbi:hypothetical protein [Kitasatospora sp. NPDC054795]